VIVLWAEMKKRWFVTETGGDVMSSGKEAPPNMIITFLPRRSECRAMS